VAAEFFHVKGRTDRQKDREADEQTDMTELIVVFRNFRTSLKITHTYMHTRDNSQKRAPHFVLPCTHGGFREEMVL
jgi:hypothetical protein